MEIDALVTDLDGTFWAPDMALHPASVAVVDRCDAVGMPFVVATGRRALSTLGGLAPAGLADRSAILMNGALVRLRLDGPSFHRSSFRTPDAQRVHDLFVSHDLDPLVYVDDVDADLLATPHASAGESFLASAPGIRRVDDLPASISAAAVIGFGAFGYTHDHLAPLQAAIEAEDLASVFISPSHYEGDYGIMVQGAGVDKATGLDALCNRLDLRRDRLAVVGDGLNDVDMLTSAAVAIVPNNAPSEVQAIADVLIEPNEAGGWSAIPEIIGV